MEPEQLALIVGAGVLSLGAICVALAAAWYSGRRYAESANPRTGRFRMPWSTDADDTPSTAEGDLDAPRRSVRDRVLRIVALLFLVAVAVVVALSPDRWQDQQSAIYLLVALGTLAVVFLGDILPASVPAGVRGWAEASVAIAFLTILTGLTDGLASPFTAGFFLVVGAGALARDGFAPVTLALVAGLAAGAAALIAALIEPPDIGFQAPPLTGIAFQALALLLLAIIGAVAGREQRRAREAALRLARFDPLTELYNRAHFFTELERELRLSQRAGRSFALLMIDLDGLKPVNDSFGHHYGDKMLQAVTQVIRHTVRTTDTPARYGGDEFVVLLPETDAAGAYVVAEKLRRDIAALAVQVSDRTIRTSVSIGLVAYPEDGTTVDGLMAAADSALYEAKRGGRDRIVGYTTRTERVATPMGAADRRQAGPAPRGPEPPPPPTEPPSPPPESPSPPREPSPPQAESPQPAPAPAPEPRAAPGPAAPAVAMPAAPASSPSAAPASSVPLGTRVSPHGQAPWETGTDGGWDEPARPRVAFRVGSDEPVTSRGPNGPSV